MIEHLKASACFTSSLNKKAVNRIRQNVLVSNSELNRILRAPFSPPPSQNKSISKKGFHYILRTVISGVKSIHSHLACRQYTLPSTSHWENTLPAFPRPPTQLSLGLNQVGSACSAAADEQESTPSPHFPSDLNYQIIPASPLPPHTPCYKGITVYHARSGPYFFLLYYTSYPAASEPLSAVAFCSLNATGLSLTGCITIFTAYL